MQALIVGNDGLFYQDDYPQPQPGVGEVLVRVLLAGICSTDLEIVKGYGSFKGILGHEFVGEVASVGDSADADWIGRRVVGTINIGCQNCEECQRNGSAHCPNRAALGIHRIDGAFADYVVLPVRNLLVVPKNVSNEQAVFTEPLAAAVRIREQLLIAPDAATAVVGPGRLGLLVGQVLALAGTRVTMLGRRQASLELPAKLGLQTALVDEFADNSFDFIVETTGNAAGFAHSLRLVRPQGTLVLKSTFAGESHINLTKIVVSEIKVVGSRCGPFAPALRLLEQNAVHVTESIDAEYALRDGLAAFAHAARPGVRKVLLRP